MDSAAGANMLAIKQKPQTVFLCANFAGVKTDNMDKEIPKSEQRRESLVRIARVGIPAALVGGALLWFLLAAGTRSVDASHLHFSQAEIGDIDATVSASGRIAPAFEEIINSPVTSRILEVRHRAGDVVEAGTPLLVLDLHAARVAAEKQADQLHMKRLELKQQTANDNTALSALEMQIKVGDMKVHRLEAELSNERYLDSIGSGTTDKVREAEFALRSARLEQEQLRQQLDNEREVRSAAADVKRLEIEIMAKEADLAGRTLGEAEIRAPRRATVTDISDKIGAQVSQGQEVAKIADLGHYKVEAEAADSYGSRIATGNRATVRFGTHSLEGTVSGVTPTAANGLVAFTVTLDNDSAASLRSGLRPDVYVSQGVKSGVVRVANGRFYTKPGKYMLFVRSADGKSLVQREVQLGVANMDYVEVVSGLEPGETIVTNDMNEYLKHPSLKLK